MRRALAIIMCLLLVISLSSCAGGDAESKKKDKTEVKTESEQTEDDAAIDIDLTTMSSTMVYAQVYDMVTNPDDFLGETVRATGPFAVYTDEKTEKNYFACIIKDATACCAQGMEFELEGKHEYPNDYPELDTEITVEGTFDKYEEAGQTYCTLRKAKIIES